MFKICHITLLFVYNYTNLWNCFVFTKYKFNSGSTFSASLIINEFTVCTDGTYSPFYPYAAKNGDGCCFNPYEIKNYYKNRMVYRIDEQYVVKHRRFALTTTHDERYPAGVHLYIDYKKAFWRLAEADQMGGNFAVIKCKYEKALAIEPFKHKNNCEQNLCAWFPLTAPFWAEIIKSLFNSK